MAFDEIVEWGRLSKDQLAEELKMPDMAVAYVDNCYNLQGLTVKEVQEMNRSEYLDFMTNRVFVLIGDWSEEGKTERLVNGLIQAALRIIS